jgi:hypothetical protein
MRDPLYKSFIFLPLLVLAASLDGETPKQVNYTAISQTTLLWHTYLQIHKIVYDKQKQNMFDNYIVHDTSETKTKTTAHESKERLRRHIVVAGFSRRVEEAVDEVISRLTALLWSWATLKDK